MILGYEAPVDIPVLSIYDKGMMQMYIQALLKDYERALDDQKEFNKTFGNFLSLSGPDMANWYKLTQGRINDFMQKNPDVIRSIEGRGKLMALTNEIAADPRLAIIRANAKQFEEHEKIKKSIIANGGTIIPDGKDPYTFDSLANGGQIFGSDVPMRLKSIEEELKPTIEALSKAKRLNEEKSKNEWLVYDVPEQSVRDALNYNYFDLMKSPSMQHHLKESGLTPELFKEMLVQQTMKQTPEDRQINSWYVKQVEMANSARQKELDRAHDSTEKAADRENALTIAGLKADGTRSNMQMLDKIEERTQSKRFGDDTINSVNSAPFINYFKNRILSVKDKKIVDRETGFLKEWQAYNKASSKDKKAFLKKYGYIDDNGQLTQKYHNWYDKVSGTMRGKATQGRYDTISNAEDYYQSYQKPLTGDEIKGALSLFSGSDKPEKNGYYKVTFGNGVNYMRTRAMDVAGGFKPNIPRNRDLSYRFSLWLTSGKVSGNAYNINEISAGKLPGNVLELANLGVTVKYDKIKEFLDIARKEKLILPSGKRANNATYSEMLNELGLSVMKSDGSAATVRVSYGGDYDTSNKESGVFSGWKKVKKTVSQTKKQDTIYISIPTSFTRNANGTSVSGVNDTFNRAMFGQANARKDTGDALLSSIIFSR